LHGAHEIGSVDASFLQSEDRRSAAFVLAGRPWRILHVAWTAGTCEVEPAESGAYPRWFGRPLMLSRALCQAMRLVLTEDATAPSWSKRAVASVQALRERHGFLRDARLPLTTEPDGSMKWWTFAGGRGNRLLATVLQATLSGRVTPGNEAIRFAGDAALSGAHIRQSIRTLAQRGRLSWSDALTGTDTSSNTRVSKFQPCLPPDIERELVARETMSPEDANLALSDFIRDGAAQSDALD
jgi:ATP-dependent Lhr-like helicase